MAFIAENGSTSAPSFRFSSDSDLGFYRKAADQMGLSTGGLWSPGISGQTSAVSNTYNLNGSTSYPDTNYSFLFHLRAKVILASTGSKLIAEGLWFISGMYYDGGMAVEYFYQQQIANKSADTLSVSLYLQTADPAGTIAFSANGGMSGYGTHQMFWRLIPVSNLPIQT